MNPFSNGTLLKLKQCPVSSFSIYPERCGIEKMDITASCFVTIASAGAVSPIKDITMTFYSHAHEAGFLESTTAGNKLFLKHESFGRRVTLELIDIRLPYGFPLCVDMQGRIAGLLAASHGPIEASLNYVGYPSSIMSEDLNLCVAGSKAIVTIANNGKMICNYNDNQSGIEASFPMGTKGSILRIPPHIAARISSSYDGGQATQSRNESGGRTSLHIAASNLRSLTITGG